MKIHQYLIRIYFGNKISNLRAPVKLKIYLSMKYKFISSKECCESQSMHSKRDKMKVIISINTKEIIYELFSQFLTRYLVDLETLMKGSDFVFIVLMKRITNVIE